MKEMAKTGKNTFPHQYSKGISWYRKNTASAAVIFLSSLLFPAPSIAQCAMCRAALETGGQAGQAQAVNSGIVYLMVIPYLLVAVLIYFVYKTGKSLGKKT